MRPEDLKPDAPFHEVLSAAIADLSATGYVSERRLGAWMERLKLAAERYVGPEYLVDQEIREGFAKLFENFTNNVRLPQHVEGVGRFTKEMVKPKLYGELDRRILAATSLIKRNKDEAVAGTLRRFEGWATSIPPGGDAGVSKRDTSNMLKKDLRDYNYHKRLVANDQGHKLISNVSALIAQEAGAIAGKWNSHGAHDSSYNARKNHLDRDGKIYLIRGSWADEQGLVRPMPGLGYMEDHEAAGQKINCRCWITYITSPRRLPDEMLTVKGQRWIEEGRQRVAALVT